MQTELKTNKISSKRSFIRTITAAAVIYLLLMILTLSVIARSIYSSLKDSAADILKQTVSSGITDLNQTLTANERALSILIQFQEDITNLSSNDSVKSNVAAQNILSQMERLTYANEELQELIVYDLVNENYLEKHSNVFTYQETLDIKQYLTRVKDRPNEIPAGQWFSCNVNGSNYFVRIYANSRRMVAVVISPERWISKINVPEHVSLVAADASGSIVGINDREGNIIEYGTDETILTAEYVDAGAEKTAYWINRNKTLLYRQGVPSNQIILLAGMPRQAVLGLFARTQILIVLLVVAAIIIITLVAVYANRVILVPFQALLDAMRRIVEGEQDYRLPTDAETQEFETVNNSFDYMMDTIVNLRMKSYEDRIQFDEATLKYVQLQIRPHFFLNALTTIHSMSFQDRNQDIREYIEYLSRNVRYLFKAGLHTVPLSEEIEHVRDYIAMQNMLYPDCVFDFIDIGPEVSDYQIPQLLIHTMLENTYKHAVSVDSLTSILISAHEEEYGGEKMCHISVEDDGAGYPDDFLEQMAKGVVKVREDGHGVGLWNLKTTLSLMYRRDDLIQFTNREPHGSRADMWIPRRAQRQSSVWKL